MPAGRPALFESPEELETQIQNYISECQDVHNNATITGLAYYLGFESRQSFYDYEKHEEFSYIIKRARLYVESNYERLLTGGKPVGAIFALKNMGWTDKRETDITTGGEKINFGGIQIVKPDDPNKEVQA